MIHLWANGPKPEEYMLFQFCDRFGGTPSQWKDQSLDDYRDFIDMWAAEAEVGRMRAKTGG